VAAVMAAAAAVVAVAVAAAAAVPCAFLSDPIPVRLDHVGTLPPEPHRDG
jgi:hypothetical protein